MAESADVYDTFDPDEYVARLERVAEAARRLDGIPWDEWTCKCREPFANPCRLCASQELLRVALVVLDGDGENERSTAEET